MRPLPEHLRVEPWTDPVIDALGFDARGPYLDFVALGWLGPTSSWCLRHFAYGLAAHPGGYDVSLPELGVQLGLGPYSGRSSHLARAIDRLEIFGMARRDGTDGLQVRTRIPPLPEHRLARLSAASRDVHRMMVAARDVGQSPGEAPPGQTGREHRHHLAAEQAAGLGR